jgi:hypothetical protein
LSGSTIASSRLSSPRFRRRLLWVGGIVLGVGLTVGLIAAFWPTPKSLQLPTTNRPAQIAPKEKTVPLEPGAKVVGEKFIETAVARKNLAESWKITAPALRSDFTLKRWLTGAIPVIPYPADTSSPAPVKIDYSYKDRALLMVLLSPRKGATMKPQLFLLGVHAFGHGANRHWLVDYWAPYGAPKIPQA